MRKSKKTVMNEWRFDLTILSLGSAWEKLSYLLVGCPGWSAACAGRQAETYLGVLGLGSSLLAATGCLELFALALGPHESKMQAAAGWKPWGRRDNGFHSVRDLSRYLQSVAQRRSSPRLGDF